MKDAVWTRRTEPRLLSMTCYPTLLLMKHWLLLMWIKYRPFTVFIAPHSVSGNSNQTFTVWWCVMYKCKCTCTKTGVGENRMVPQFSLRSCGTGLSVALNQWNPNTGLRAIICEQQTVRLSARTALFSFDFWSHTHINTLPPVWSPSPTPGPWSCRTTSLWFL